MPKSEPWRYEKLTWPEINQAIEAKKVVVVPIGSTEQHGPHLPLDVDVVCPTGVAHAAARLIPDEVLVMPPMQETFPVSDSAILFQHGLSF